MATSSDVPNKYDCIINGQGYLFAPSDTGLPPSVFGVKNEFSFTPTFVTRQNTQGDYGDNQQDFWLTYTQRDWSLGEQQRYQGRDSDGVRRYWQGTAVDVTTPGKVALRKGVVSATAAANVLACTTGVASSNNIFFVTSTKLYNVQPDGTINDLGLHGLGASPSNFALCSDSLNIYISTTNAGTVGVRRYNIAGAAFSTFSATGSDALVFLNNTLYGYSNGVLRNYDTGGTATTQFTWKDATGAAIGVATRLRAFGGKVLILHQHDGSDRGSELWQFDGVGVSKMAEFPPNFLAKDCEVLFGIVFISGVYQRSSTEFRPAILFYANGTLGETWKADSWGTASAPGVSTYDGGLVFSDDISGQFKYYNPGTGGIHSLGATASASNSETCQVVGWTQSFASFRLGETAIRSFPSSTLVSSGTITSSIIDFDSSLTKLFRGIKIEFDSATDGDGGSVDISYRLADVDGSYTSLQTGATSGTEYALTGVSGRSISIKVTLNKGTSTSGPVLKSVAVRAAPIEPVYKQFQYVLSLAGVNDRDPYEGSMGQLRDGTFNPLDGNQQAANLVTAITSSTPISCYDAVNGTMSSVFLDQSNCKISQVKPGEYIAVINGREV